MIWLFAFGSVLTNRFTDKSENIRKLLSSVVVLFLFFPLYAQWSVGGKVGLNGSSVHFPGSGGVELDSKYCMGLNGGFFTQYQFNHYFGLQAELLYMKSGYKLKDWVYEYENIGEAPLDMDVALHYLEIPLLAKFTHKTGLNLQLGPQVGFMLKRRLRYGEEVQSQMLLGKKQPFDLSLAFGAGYEAKNGLLFDFRYLLGLTSVYKNVEGFQNRAFYLSLGYKFDL